jgi:NAD+ kinase
MTHVVLATKTTAWQGRGEWYQEQHQLGRLADKDFNRIKNAHDEHLATVDRARTVLADAKIAFREVNVDDNSWSLDSDTRIVLTLGGDGTLLSASHRISAAHNETTLMGVRSSGLSVGYLCSGGPDKLSEIASTICSGSFDVLIASRVEAEIHPTKKDEPIRKTPPALNDFLFSNANPAATTRYVIRLGEREEDHKSSGLWVSTALGSTAGVSAAGGVIQPRSDRNFQFLVRELYRPAGRNFFLINGFFDAEKKCLSIENRCEEAILAADGSHGMMNVSWGEKIVFKRATPVRIAQ